MTQLWNRLQSHQRAALAIAVIVALADTVIVYDLHLSGAWLSPSWLSWLKTTAFVLLFVGSLIAEMQELQGRTRWLLFAAVVLLGVYQATVNVVVNFHAATIPPSAATLFAPWLSALQVKFWYSMIDGAIRTGVVIIMWLVTGLVWRGLAVNETVDTHELAELQSRVGGLQSLVQSLQSDLATMETERDQAQAVAISVQVFGNLETWQQVQWIAEHRNGEGPSNQQLAEWYNVSPSTIGRWITRKED